MANVTCNTCGGSGKYTNQFGNEVTCYTCGGSGTVPESWQPKKK